MNEAKTRAELIDPELYFIVDIADCSRIAPNQLYKERKQQ